jgi:hypothetical protein
MTPLHFPPAKLDLHPNHYFTMSTHIRPGDLKPGDVLLYHGSSLIARLIRWFDGTEYHHSGIWQGDHVVEAISNGVASRSLEESVGGAMYVDVYRYHRLPQKEPLGSPGLPPEPVLAAVAQFEVNRQRYAYEGIVLLALLAATRRTKLPFGLGILLRNLLDEAAEKVAEIVAAGKEPMICSELVYRCYESGGAPYKILIRGADIALANAMALGAQSTTIAAANWSQETGDDYPYEEASAFLDNYYAVKGGDVSIAAVADFVTPGDLSKSPNLWKLGTLRL